MWITILRGDESASVAGEGRYVLEFVGEGRRMVTGKVSAAATGPERQRGEGELEFDPLRERNQTDSHSS